MIPNLLADGWFISPMPVEKQWTKMLKLSEVVSSQNNYIIILPCEGFVNSPSWKWKIIKSKGLKLENRYRIHSIKNKLYLSLFHKK